MDKKVRLKVALLLAIGISITPCINSHAADVNEENVLEYDADNLDDIFNQENDPEVEEELEIDDELIENDQFKTENSDVDKKEDKQSIENDKSVSKNKETHKEKNKKIEDKISNMTLDEKIGQMLMLEFRYWEDQNWRSYFVC